RPCLARPDLHPGSSLRVPFLAGRRAPGLISVGDGDGLRGHGIGPLDSDSSVADHRLAARRSPLRRRRGDELSLALRRDRRSIPRRLHGWAEGAPSPRAQPSSFGLLAARLRNRSSATAATMIPPVSTSCTQFGTPSILNPLRITVINSAPASDPPTLPWPPARLPPPITTEAMMSSSMPLAAVGSPTVSRLNCIQPAKPVRIPPRT